MELDEEFLIKEQVELDHLSVGRLLDVNTYRLVLNRQNRKKYLNLLFQDNSL